MKRLVSIIIASVLIMASPLVVSASTGDDGGLLDGFVDGIIEGLKSLFVPDGDFFEEHIEHMRGAIDNKTGGLASYFESITGKFNQLQNSQTINNTLKLKLPDNLLYNGYKGKTADMLAGIGDFASWFKGLFSAFMVVTTIILCYRKLTAMFKE